MASAPMVAQTARPAGLQLVAQSFSGTNTLTETCFRKSMDTMSATELDSLRRQGKSFNVSVVTSTRVPRHTALAPCRNPRVPTATHPRTVTSNESPRHESQTQTSPLHRPRVPPPPMTSLPPARVRAQTLNNPPPLTASTAALRRAALLVVRRSGLLGRREAHPSCREESVGIGRTQPRGSLGVISG